MVRLDKILHMITCFKIDSNLKEELQYSSPLKDTKISKEVYLIFQRMGVISVNHNLNFTESDVLESIPFGREKFLLDSLDSLNRKCCTKNAPKCSLCILGEHCDYKNKKNDWIVN